MTNFSVVVYDIEIINPIRPKKLEGAWLETLHKWQLANPDKQIKFCDSWTDFSNMGIACIGAYDYQTDQYRTFLKDNFDDFIRLVENRTYLVGYNSATFDDNILHAYSLICETTANWDLLACIWSTLDSLGLSRKNSGLDTISKANNLPGKLGDGMLAALNWQMGNYGKTIDYCLNDVWLTKKLLDILAVDGSIVDANGNILEIDLPWIA